VVAHGDGLVEGLHDGKLHDPFEVRLTGHKQFFVFPDCLRSDKVRELNSSAALLTRGSLRAAKDLPACAFVGLGEGLSTS
jgi:hypothetical protein